MSSVCLVLHAHHPHLMKRFSVFDSAHQYFDLYRTRESFRRYVAQCIEPVNRILLRQIERLEGRLRVTLAVTGATLDLLERYHPSALDSFHRLVATGCVEFAAMPYHHGLAFLYAPQEFETQIEMHILRLVSLFDTRPAVFCNTELIYSDSVAGVAAEMGCRAVLCGGNESTGDGPRLGPCGIVVLPRHAALTREVAARFSERGRTASPLMASDFADSVRQAAAGAGVVTLVWDYAVFGRLNSIETGVFEFLRHLPEKILESGDIACRTCSGAVVAHPPTVSFRSKSHISPPERRGDLSTWLGNALQSHALHRLYALCEAVQRADDAELVAQWRQLQCCECFAAMNTQQESTESVATFGDESPYDAYINFMNICDSIEGRSQAATCVEQGRLG